MRIVVAFGGNALLRRGEPLTAAIQRRNIEAAADALAPLLAAHEAVLTHGNGPQVGMLAMRGAAEGEGAFPLDVLDAETEGMIGYLIQQAVANRLPAGRNCVALTTRVEVAADDPAFRAPTKPIGPGYTEDEARALAQKHGWTVAPDGARWRRVVASPAPVRILELDAVRLLLANGFVPVCAGGGGIPVVARPGGGHEGVEAVIDKDRSSALLAREIGADALLMLTDAEAVMEGWGTPEAKPIRRIAAAALDPAGFEPGTMRPKIEAAVDFVTATGGVAGIGRLEDAARILEGEAGTLVEKD